MTHKITTRLVLLALALFMSVHSLETKVDIGNINILPKETRYFPLSKIASTVQDVQFAVQELGPKPATGDAQPVTKRAGISVISATNLASSTLSNVPPKPTVTAGAEPAFVSVVTSGYICVATIANSKLVLNFAKTPQDLSATPTIDLSVNSVTLQADNTITPVDINMVGGRIVVLGVSGTAGDANTPLTETIFAINPADKSILKWASKLSTFTVASRRRLTTCYTQGGLAGITYSIYTETPKDTNPQTLVVYLIDKQENTPAIVPKTDINVKVFKMRANFNGITIFSTEGTIAFCKFAVGIKDPTQMLTAMSYVTNVGDAIVATDAWNKDINTPLYAVATQKQTFIIKNGQVTASYTPAFGASIADIEIDEKFVYIMANMPARPAVPGSPAVPAQPADGDKPAIPAQPAIPDQPATDAKLTIYTYDLTSNQPNNYLDAQDVTGFGTFLTSETFKAPGRLLFTDGQKFFTFDVQEPYLLIDGTTFTQDVETPVQYNIMYGGKTKVANVKVVKKDAVYNANGKTPQIAGMNRPKVNLDQYFIGPLLSIDGTENTIRGACSIADGVTGYDANTIVNVQVLATAKDAKAEKANALVTTIKGKTISWKNIEISNFQNHKGSQACAAASKDNGQPSDKPDIALANPPTKCVFGREYIICLVDGNLVHVTNTANTIQIADSSNAKTNVPCKNIAAFDLGNNYGQGTLCMNDALIQVFDKGGALRSTIKPADIGETSNAAAPFAGIQATALPFSDFVLISYPKTLVGIQIPITPETSKIPIRVYFRTTVNEITATSQVVYTGDYAVIINADTGIIVEYDLRDNWLAQLVRTYDLAGYGYTVNPKTAITYQVSSNHLVLFGKKSGDTANDYMLILQPGDVASNYFEYANVVQVPAGATSFILHATSDYDFIKRNTLVFIPTDKGITYYYAHYNQNSALPALPSTVTGCLYCQTSANVKVNTATNPANSLVLNSLTYTVIKSEQDVTVSTTDTVKNYVLKQKKPMSEMANTFFVGTVLDYNFPVSPKAQSKKTDVDAFVYYTPITQMTNSLTTSVTGPAGGNMNTILFGNHLRAYALYDTGAYMVDLTVKDANKLAFTQVAMTSPPAGAKFVAGADELTTGTVVLSYIAGNHAGLYIPSTGKTIDTGSPAIELHFVDKYIFALQSGYVNILSVYENDKTNGLVLVKIMKQGTFNRFTAISEMDVLKLADKTYAIMLVDQTKWLYYAHCQIDSTLEIAGQVVDDVSKWITNDLLHTGVSVYNAELNKATVIANDPKNAFKLTVTLIVEKVHSYQVELFVTKGGEPKFDTIKNVFPQIAGHHSTGMGLATDHYFVDIKDQDGNLYMVSYPFDSIYEVDFSKLPEVGAAYVNPIQRQLLGAKLDLPSINILGGDGKNCTVVVNMGAKFVNNQYQLNFAVYNLTHIFAINFNPVLKSNEIAKLKKQTLAIVAKNDYSTATLSFNVDPTGSILDNVKNYWWAWLIAVIFVLALIIGCVYYRKRWVKKQAAQYNEPGYAAIDNSGSRVKL